MQTRTTNRLKAIIQHPCDFLGRGGVDMGAANVRLLLALTVYIYLLTTKHYHGQAGEGLHGILFMAMTYFIYSLLQWLSNLLWPGPHLIRRAISILVDTSIVTYAMIAAGETTSPFFGGYLWVTIANGLRYGRRYLYVTNIFSVLGFSLVLWFSPYWHSQLILGTGLLVWLILLPGHVAALLKRLEDALLRAKSANKSKRNFLSNMSHELRTPLNVIIGYSDMLQEDALAEGNRQIADDMSKIQRSANHLLALINGILDLSRIESGKMHFTGESFDIRLFFEDILASMQSRFAQRGNLFAIRFDLHHYQIYTDKMKLKQIIISLLDNANKFTHGGQIQINVSANGGYTNSIVTVCIRDNGIGIPKAKINSIFEPFIQADCSSTRKYEGAGLGLAVARRFAEILDGDIDVSSQECEGSTFSVRLPQRLPLCTVGNTTEQKLEPPRKMAG